MNRKTTFAIALAFSVGASLLAAAPPTRPPGPVTGPGQPKVFAPQITGTIRWHVDDKVIEAKKWNPTAADTCAQFTVEAYAPATSGGSGKALGISSKGLGQWKSGACQYVLGGVAGGTQLELRASYKGPLGTQQGVAQSTQLKTPFLVEKGKQYENKDLQVDFKCKGTEFPCS